MRVVNSRVPQHIQIFENTGMVKLWHIDHIDDYVQEYATVRITLNVSMFYLKISACFILTFKMEGCHVQVVYVRF